MAPQVLPKGSQKDPQCDENLTLGSLGPLWDPKGHYGPKMTPTGTKITLKSRQKAPKMIKIIPKIGRNFGRVQILVLTSNLLKKKKKGRALRPVFPFFGGLVF